MQEDLLKTSWKQRVFIAIIALILLGSTLAVYVAIVISGGSTSTSSDSDVDEELIAEIQEEYDAKYEEYSAAGDELSEKYFEKFKTYLSEVKSYNSETANEKLTYRDLKEGSGETITTDSEDYGAYYIGFCSDESIFDSSFDDSDDPTSLQSPLVVTANSLIEGWYQGVNGMKIGGVREVTIPGELAYGDSQEICDGTNSPLKFIIMPVEVSDDFLTLSDEMSTLYTRLQYAYYGIDYSE